VPQRNRHQSAIEQPGDQRAAADAERSADEQRQCVRLGGDGNAVEEKHHLGAFAQHGDGDHHRHRQQRFVPHGDGTCN